MENNFNAGAQQLLDGLNLMVAGLREKVETSMPKDMPPEEVKKYAEMIEKAQKDLNKVGGDLSGMNNIFKG